jgi:AcrR family transcriptional regulator
MRHPRAVYGARVAVDRTIELPTPALREAMATVPVPVRPTPGAAFALARAWVRAGRRLDMAGLAAELGVSRNTLYRWTGDRDRLLADVVWADLELMLDASWSVADGGGAQRLQQAGAAFIDAVAQRSAIRPLLANEGASGLRLLTDPAGPIRPRIVARVAGAIEEEARAGRYAPPAPPAVLADGVVSLGERFLHHGGDPALNPDPRNATAIISLLLRE